MTTRLAPEPLLLPSHCPAQASSLEPRPRVLRTDQRLGIPDRMATAEDQIDNSSGHLGTVRVWGVPHPLVCGEQVGSKTSGSRTSDKGLGVTLQAGPPAHTPGSANGADRAGRCGMHVTGTSLSRLPGEDCNQIGGEGG